MMFHIFVSDWDIHCNDSKSTANITPNLYLCKTFLPKLSWDDSRS